MLDDPKFTLIGVKKDGGGAGRTVTVTVVEVVIDPEIPVMVTVEVPGVAELVATTVIEVEALDGGFEPKLRVTPDGSPLTLNVTAPENPFAPVRSRYPEAEVPRYSE
jgi:hypothetical protein